jgi:hypothetical protein
MRSRWFIALPLVVAAVAVCLMPSVAEARRGRGSSSPFVKTPFGLIPKSVYNAPFVQNPQQLEKYKKAEEAYMKKQGANNGSTTKKPTTTTKKK